MNFDGIPLTDIGILAMAVSALSMTVSKSNAMYWFRSLLSKGGSLLSELVHCPYCLSHWFAFSLVATLYGPTFPTLILVTLAIVALSSLASFGITYFFLALDALEGESE